MRTQASVDNTVHDLRYEIKFENCVKDKNYFFIKQNIFAEADTKKTLAKTSNAAPLKLTK